MKCPKCGYQSFNNLTACKKCGRDLTQEQQKLNFGNPVVVPQPTQSPKQPDPATTEVPAAPVSEPITVKEPELPEDEHVLEDFFQSIDSLDQDQIPAAPPTDITPPTTRKKRSSAKSKASTIEPHWSREAPQGDFPFEEIDSDLDALRLSSSAEAAAEDASPFDDVDTFEIDWQSPADEAAFSKTEPTVAKKTDTRPPLSTPEETPETLPTIKEPATQQPETASIEEVIKPCPTEPAAPAPPSVREQLDEDEEWPLPELPAGHQSDKSFALEESGEPAMLIDEIATEAEAFVPQPIEVQQELPLAARDIEIPAKQPNIAAIFLPDAERDPIASGAQLLTRRAKAYLADLGLLTVIFAFFICAGEVARSPAAKDRFQFTSDVLLDLATPYFLVFFALCFGYFTLFHYLSGQTPGKMLFDVRVEGDDHAGITLAQAFLRCVGGLISLLPAGLGFLSIVLNEEQRGWNDQLAGCQVVMLEKSEED